MASYKRELDAKRAKVEKTIQSKDKKKLIHLGDEFKERINELSDHIKRLKDNGRTMKRLQYDLEEILDNVDNLQIKLDAETSSPNPNEEKIKNYTNEKEELNKQQKQVHNKIEKMHKNSGSIVKDTENLEIENEQLQEYGDLLEKIKDALNKHKKERVKQT
ncbi:unnamed protein product [Rotaria magnacalcarata]|uniref:Uncharacterized protein n=2 Tax=Rotaria TaxID=231623 RepID=A0A815HN60_9BILA|nr:unnamed protein product [Rotaria magnacalcarata]CAF3753729.1 unnamed protein product [Rotaria socialis]CAF1476166.1 unnamed protein product [Rotaria magnacalcarata]CAF4076635.1 unnamed protein product [Rotaria magnacalcarata]CAF4219765.1 unnamed protein product [Rotaria magnacalcarata]